MKTIEGVKKFCHSFFSSHRNWPFGLLFLLIISLPIFTAGYYGDDALNSLILGEMQMSHKTLFEFSRDIIVSWLDAGRFIPIAFASTYIIFDLFRSLNEYQFVRLVFIWSSVFLFALLIKKITQSKNTALLLVFLLPMFWSIRYFLDPLTSFAILLPLVSIFSSFSIIMLIKHSETKNYFYLVLSLISYMLGLLTYEISIVILPSVIIVAWLNRKTINKFILDLSPYFILTLIYSIFCLWLHLTSNQVYSGIAIGSLNKMVKAFFYQATACLPLSYIFFIDVNKLFHYYFSHKASLLIIMLLLITTYTLYISFLKKFSISKQAIKCLFLLGLNFIIVPSALIAISQRYQAYLKLGLAHLPVYLEYFGAACVLLALLGFLHLIVPFNNIKNAGLAALFSIVTTFACMANYYNVNQANNYLKFPRILLEEALQNDLLSDVPKDSVIILSRETPWNQLSFFYALTQITQTNKNPHAKFLIDTYHLPDTSNGYVITGHITHSNEKHYELENIKVFISAKNRAQYKKIIKSYISRFNELPDQSVDANRLYLNL